MPFGLQKITMEKLISLGSSPYQIRRHFLLVPHSQSLDKSFEPLEKVIEKESILNHYLVRISHDATEALLSTIEEQRIDLLITEFETFRRNKALQALVTCKVLAVLAGGTSDEDLVLDESDRNNEPDPNQIDKRKLWLFCMTGETIQILC